ncbi:unnamed protein product [Vitrella brassicaformis CCMP3155]|uniref:Peptidyl-prolyl cis-trans isomerase n=2 Tax=Vitrella brassicaformis TaxID=1169539 RepID=A0A0G4GYE9_VITBC|nr:unnamed protein product [Vitrella brassicaformis CCMP3155]|eukprot:CEM36139.1 unnamed protein product [Vitrella brassicaformis CCMP3155]
MAVLLETSVGDLVIDLHTTECPQACTNFLKLCKIKYYNNCLFYAVQKDFVTQSGDPTNTGRGGDSIFKLLGKGPHFQDEISPKLKHDRVGVVATNNSHPNENTSQFYITLRDKIDYLDGRHTIFGVVAEGADILLNKINPALLGDDGRPIQNIRIRHTHVLEDPFDDPEGLGRLVPDKSPEAMIDEELKPFENQEDEAEVIERIETGEAKSRAVALEILGDLPDADMKPPDNVLFVCKLNPHTQDDDLELIFSRFGAIKKCEVIRDWKTGDSLQYAFVEFENNKSCEDAYFKMQDCLVDDHRIHVDFCQSVSKQWRQFRRQGAKGSREDAQEANALASSGGRRGRHRQDDDAKPLNPSDAAAQYQRGGRPGHGFVFGDSQGGSQAAAGQRGGRFDDDDRDRGRDRDRDRDRWRGRDDSDRRRNEDRRGRDDRGGADRDDRDRHYERSGGRRERERERDRDTEGGRRRSRSRDRL